LARCETVTAATAHLVFCFWINTQALIEMAFVKGDRTTSDPLVPTILSAILT
jgi:hypothetical protein